jgi:hypothetical protein
MKFDYIQCLWLVLGFQVVLLVWGSLTSDGFWAAVGSLMGLTSDGQTVGS